MEIAASQYSPDEEDLEIIYNQTSARPLLNVEYQEDKDKKPKIPGKLLHHLNLIFARQGILPESHPLVKYVQNLFTRINEDPSIKLIVFEGCDPSETAFAAITRTIVLSKEILAVCDTEEELLFLLHHELKHIKKNHFQPHIETTPWSEKVGTLRLQENLDADIGSLFDLDKKGVNIAGAFSLFEKLKIKNKNAKNLSHGSALERLINLKLTLNLKDFDHYDPSKQKPLPEDVFTEENLKDTYGFPVNREAVKLAERTAIRMERAESMSFRELFVNYLDLQQNYLQAKKAFSKNDLFLKNKIKHYKPLLSKMFELIVAKGIEEIGLETNETELLVKTVIKLMELRISTQEIEKPTPELTIENPSEHELEFEKYFLSILSNAELTKLYVNLFKKLNASSLKGKLFYPLDLPLLPYILHKRKELIIENENAANLLDLFELLNIEFNYGSEITVQINNRAEANQIQGLENQETERQQECTSRPFKLMNTKEYEKYKNFLKTLKDSILDMAVSKDDWKERCEDISFKDSDYSYEPFDIDEFNQSLIREAGSSGIKHLSGDCINFIYRLFYARETFFTIENVNKLFLKIESAKLTSIEKTYIYTALFEFISLYGLQGRCNISEADEQINLCFEKLTNTINDLEINESVEDSFTLDIKDIKLNFFNGSLQIIKSLKVKKAVNFIKKICEAGNFSNGITAEAIGNWFAIISKTRKITLDEFEEIMSLFEAEEEFKRLNSVAEHKGPDFLERFIKAVTENYSEKLNLNEIERIIAIFEKFNRLSDPVFYKLLAAFDWKFGNMEECFIAHRLSKFCVDPVKSSLLAKKVSKAMVDLMNQQNISLKDFFAQIPPSIKLSFEMIEYLLEQEAKTAEDFEVCKKYLVGLRNPGEIGKFVIIDNVITEAINEKPLDLLKALLNPNNDDDLKELMFKVLIFAKETIGMGDEEGDFVKEKRDLVDEQGLPQQILDGLYNLDDYQKQTLIHSLLTGPNGILNSEKKMAELIDYFFEHYIEIPEDEKDAVFIAEAKKILKLTISNAKPEDIYFVLSKLIHGRILKAPKTDKWLHLESVKDEKDRLFHHYNYNDLTAAKRIKNFIFGKKADKSTKLRVQTDHYFKSTREQDKKAEKIDAVGLLIEIAQSMGSIGVRFLQLMGMYMDVPVKYEAAINKTFSDLKGQYKLTAYDTLKERIPVEMLENLEIGSRLGGGSILTVYPFKSKELQGVIKVVNPNIVGQMHTIFDVLEKTFAQLLEEDKDRYEPLQLLLEDVRDWVLADVKISDCVGLDGRFREQNTGLLSASGQFRSEVPEVLYSNGKSIIEEEAIGKTLQYAKLESGEMKDIIGLIRNLLAMQVANGIVHSDIHPGNFIVTNEKVLKILDRTLLLKLTPEESMLLINSAMQGDPEQMMNYFIGKVIALSANSHIDSTIAKEIFDHIEKISADSNLDALTKAKKILVYIRQKGVKISFNLTMTLKNLLAVETLMQRAG